METIVDNIVYYITSVLTSTTTLNLNFDKAKATKKYCRRATIHVVLVIL